MSVTHESLPITETIRPNSLEEVMETLQTASRTGEPIYPVGGGTSLDYGCPARQPGKALQLTDLSKVIEYPAEDMTITVQAGMTIRQLNSILAERGQQLPLDAPQAEHATIGGVLATNTSGPRRFGFGTARDYLIGVQAVDGLGRAFSGGGRVVKNVAGYDFCKMLIGSLGTLGVITQVTFKLKPRSNRRTIVACQINDMVQLESVLVSMIHSQTYPAALEFITGPKWSDLTDDTNRLFAIFEGPDTDLEWMSHQVTQEWQQQGVNSIKTLEDEETENLFSRLTEFPANENTALTLKTNVVPSGITSMIQAARELDSNCSIQAHAGSGIANLIFDEFPAEGLSRSLTGFLRPAAANHHGNVTVLRNPSGQEMTRQSVWGGLDHPFWMMDRIKQQFDPQNILNPERFVYS